MILPLLQLSMLEQPPSSFAAGVLISMMHVCVAAGAGPGTSAALRLNSLGAQESSKRVDVVMSKCWKVWHGGRDPPPEHEKAFKKLREKVRLSETQAGRWAL